MSYLTSGYIPATLHKVTLSNAERYSFAYFHEPSFDKSEYQSSDYLCMKLED
jgi:isopenicillin N synthase-like dioxygenase